MRSEFVSQEKNRIEIKVEFEASEFGAEMDNVLKKISERVNIPGFRKGHIPRKTLEMRYGKGAIHDETIESLLNENISDIMKDYDIEPLFAPTLKSKGAIIDGQPVSINLLIEARPEIQLPVLEDIEIEHLISIVDNSMIDEMINKLLMSQAKFETTNAPVQDDSVVTVEVKMMTLDVDGHELSRSKKPEMATIYMQELPDEEFRKPLIGKVVGDNAEVTIKNKVNAESIDLALTSTRYEMKIIEIGKRILPELTPEFYKNCMGFDCPTEEDFRDAIATRILNKLQNDASADSRARAVNAVAEKSVLEVPPSLVYHEMQKTKALDEQDAKERYKTELKELLKLKGMEYADYEKQIMGRSWLIVRNSLVIEEIGRKYEVKIEPTDLDQWIKEIAEKDNLDHEVLKKMYYKDKESLNLLVDRVFSDKIIDLIMEKIKVNEVSQLTPPVDTKTEESEVSEKPEEIVCTETELEEETIKKESEKTKKRKTEKKTTTNES